MKFRYEALQVIKKSIASTTYGFDIFRAVQAWLLASEATVDISGPTRGLDPSIHRALASQAAIEWLNMFRGFVSVDWRFIYSTTDYTPMHVRRERITG